MVLLEYPNTLTDGLILKASDPSSPNQKLQCLLWPSLRNDMPSLWLYVIGLSKIRFNSDSVWRETHESVGTGSEGPCGVSC